jgi:hypothetical protein
MATRCTRTIVPERGSQGREPRTITPRQVLEVRSIAHGVACGHREERVKTFGLDCLQACLLEEDGPVLWSEGREASEA